MGLRCADLWDLILIMIRIPPKSGWVETAYCYLEQVCRKKRNRIDIGNIKELFSLAVIKLKLKRNVLAMQRKLKFLVVSAG